jgi:arginine decarboxylase
MDSQAATPLHPKPPAAAGWEKETPIPDGAVNGYLRVRGGQLFLEDLNLTKLILGSDLPQGLPHPPGSPLEIVYLPLIPEKIAALRKVFDDVIAETGYGGRFLYAYPSKANAAEEVVRKALQTGVHFEISSAMDVDLIRIMLSRGYLTSRQMILCNGFKPGGSAYARHILDLQRIHGNVVPIVDDLAELPFLADSGRAFEVGLRQKSYGRHDDIAEMNEANSQFGMQLTDIARAAARIADAPNLTLRVYHAMVGGQIDREEDFIARLTPPIEIYAKLRQRHPDLTIFDFGGGIPAPMALDFDFDYPAFARLLLTAVQKICRRFGVPEPDLMGEVGRYTVAEHGAHIFQVELVKENKSKFPWYILNGSIMTSFPDVWALKELFTVLPVTNLDRPFRRVQLAGLTCDSDDVYPPKGSASPLYLPADADNLFVGFFGIGAYQEMLGGMGGVKHCVIPEADELIIDRDAEGKYTFRVNHGQDLREIARTLGYRRV